MDQMMNDNDRYTTVRLRCQTAAVRGEMHAIVWDCVHGRVLVVFSFVFMQLYPKAKQPSSGARKQNFCVKWTLDVTHGHVGWGHRKLESQWETRYYDARRCKQPPYSDASHVGCDFI